MSPGAAHLDRPYGALGIFHTVGLCSGGGGGNFGSRRRLHYQRAAGSAGIVSSTGVTAIDGTGTLCSVTAFCENNAPFT